MKRPAFQFYPGDWLRSTDLRSCSVGARGLWIDMICLMHEGCPYGYLRVGSKDISEDILARITGCSATDCHIWLKELFDAGVYGLDGTTIYSRRMLRDERTRNARSVAGVKSLNNPNVPRPRISSPPSLGVSPASAFASASASASTKTKTRARATKKGNGEIPFTLPPELDADLWQEFMLMRQKIRKPATNRAKWLLIGKLANLEKEGNNPRHVLQQSIRNSWQDVFPLREENRK